MAPEADAVDALAVVAREAAVNPRTRWRIAFLGLTALVLGMEVYAGVDGNPDTRPWTDEIVAYVPGEVTAVGIGGLSLWLIVHFGRRYWRQRQAAEET